MKLEVQVVSIEHGVSIQKKDGGSYQGSRLTYRYDGKIQEQAFHTNTLKYNPSLAEQLKGIAAGDNVVIDKEKEGDFWKVKSVTKNGSSAPTNETPASNGTTAKSTAAPRSTYETPEERAARQVMIVRQSSLSTAVNLLAANGGKKNSVKEVIKAAQEFEAYVMGMSFDDGTIESLVSDDIEVM